MFGMGRVWMLWFNSKGFAGEYDCLKPTRRAG
jgi:hypothetical protein